MVHGFPADNRAREVAADAGGNVRRCNTAGPSGLSVADSPCGTALGLERRPPHTPESVRIIACHPGLLPPRLDSDHHAHCCPDTAVEGSPRPPAGPARAN